MHQPSKLGLSVFFALGFLAALASLAILSASGYSNSVGYRLGFFGGKQAYCAESVSTLFSPGAQEEFAGHLSSAQSTVDVMLYQFSNPLLEETLAKARARGVRIRVLLEPRVDSNYAMARLLAEDGIEVRWASKEYTNTHAKTAVIDGKNVVVGSTNWSVQAMRSNREAGVVVDSVGLAGEFERVFEEDWGKGKQFVLQPSSS